VVAPFVGESVIKMGLELQEFHRVESNGTIVVVGKVVYVELGEDLLFEDGAVDLVKADAVGSVGLDGYVSSAWLDRLSYAKPDKAATSILP